MATSLSLKSVGVNTDRNCYDVLVEVDRGDGPQLFGFMVSLDQVDRAFDDMELFAAQELAEMRMAGTLPEIPD